MFKRLLYKNRKFYDDDFDWDNYTADSYARRVSNDIETQFITELDPTLVAVDRKAGRVELGGQLLHPNHQLILDAIAKLAPNSVHEVGCGGGDHVANATRVFPEVSVSGGDRSVQQLQFALKRHPELNGKIGIQDITMPFSNQWPQVEFVYTQAVIMHIHTAVSHLIGLTNLFRISSKYVLLVENVQCHHFVETLKALKSGGHIPWSEIFLHRFDGSTGASGILVSKEELDLPTLGSDSVLREGLKPSRRRLKRATEDLSRGQFGFSKDLNSPQ